MLKKLGVWFFVLLLIVSTVIGISGERIITDDDVTVRIDYAGNQGGIIIEDIKGAEATQVGQGGTYNSETREIRWLFFDDSVSELSYSVTGDGEVSGSVTSGEDPIEVEIIGDYVIGDGLPLIKDAYDLRIQGKTLQDEYIVGVAVEITDPPSIFQRIVSWFRGLLVGRATGVLQVDTLTPEEDQSKIVNNERGSVEVFLRLSVEEYVESTDSWDEVIVVFNDQEARAIRGGGQVKLDIIWNAAGGWIADREGIYRVHGELRNILDEIILDLDGEEVVFDYEFEVLEEVVEEQASSSGFFLPPAPIGPDGSSQSSTDENTSTEVEEVQEEAEQEIIQETQDVEEEIPDDPTDLTSEENQETIPEEESVEDQTGFTPPAPSVTPGGDTTDEDTEDETEPEEEQTQEEIPVEEEPEPEEEDQTESADEEPTQEEDQTGFTPPAPPTIPGGEDTTDEEEDEIIEPTLPTPPTIPGGSDEPSAVTPPSPPTVPGTSEEPGAVQTPAAPGVPDIGDVEDIDIGCCLSGEIDGRVCYRTTIESCQNNVDGVFKIGGCGEEDHCLQVLPCFEGDTKLCAAFSADGVRTCTAYGHYGACIIEDVSFVQRFDNDLDNDPDLTDCAPDNDQMGHYLPEICADDIDNNCNFMVDEEDCMSLAQARRDNLIGFAFAGALEQANLWRSASIIFSMIMAIVLAVSGFHYWRRNK
jgi:hypothetical protein